MRAEGVVAKGVGLELDAVLGEGLVVGPGDEGDVDVVGGLGMLASDSPPPSQRESTYMMQPRGIEAPDGSSADKDDVDVPGRVGPGPQRVDASHCAGRGYLHLDSVVSLTLCLSSRAKPSSSVVCESNCTRVSHHAAVTHSLPPWLTWSPILHPINPNKSSNSHPSHLQSTVSLTHSCSKPCGVQCRVAQFVQLIRTQPSARPPSSPLSPKTATEKCRRHAIH